MPEQYIKTPKTPLNAALIGCGVRSTNFYIPLFKILKQWINITAVCDPVKENADRAALELNVKAYYNIHELIKDRPMGMDAAIVVTPVESHHSISVTLSENKIHNLVETTWCSMIWQAKDMIQKAGKNGVIVRVAENFYRFAADRFAMTVKNSGYIGNINRIMCYNDHTGYHNNSRWINFFGKYPESVQCIEHTMPTKTFHSSPERYHETEEYSAHFYRFPDNKLVIDHASNIKGFLGRQMRPGYTEWQGESGTLIHRGVGYWEWESELRKSSQKDSGFADIITPVIYDIDLKENCWTKTYSDTPEGTIEYINPYRAVNCKIPHVNSAFYGCVSMGVILHFALEVLGLEKCEFNDNDALMSLMMEIGAKESVLNGGKRVSLPITGEPESDEITRRHIQKQIGVDPYDVEAMLNISYPKP